MARHRRLPVLVLVLAGLLCASAALPEHEHRHAHAHRRRSRARAPAAAPRSGAHHAEHLEHPAGSAAASGGALERGGGAGEEGGFEEEEEEDSAAEPPRRLCRGREQVAARHLPALFNCRVFCLSACPLSEWVDHPDANHTGLYDPAAQCPEFAKDFVCGQPYEPARPDPGLYAREFRKVFRPRECELRPWDAAGFERCLAGRRLVMVGDSLMRQTFTVRARAAVGAGRG